MRYQYFEQTTYYRPKPQKEPDNPFVVAFGVIFWFFVIGCVVNGCNH